MCVKKALERLSPCISEGRRAKIASVVSSRTNSISILLENVTNETNEYAIVRSMEALGSFHLHRLSTKKYPSPSKAKLRYPPRTDSGARKWINIHQWNDTSQCISHLKEQGYVMAIASPNGKHSVRDLDFSKKHVVAFGNEVEGISEDLARFSDFEFSLPMCGFVESFNVSVAAAITLYHGFLHRMSVIVSRNVLCLCLVSIAFA